MRSLLRKDALLGSRRVALTRKVVSWHATKRQELLVALSDHVILPLTPDLATIPDKGPGSRFLCKVPMYSRYTYPS